MSLEGRPDRSRSLATIHAALDAGVRLIDTAFAYRAQTDTDGHNELLIAQALRTWSGDRDSVVVATKGGHYRHPQDPPGGWSLSGNPTFIKNSAKTSARALGVESIALYYHHRPDPSVAYEDQIGALVDLIDQGVIRTAGISNANPDQIRLARGLLGANLVAVQNQFNPVFRTSEPELELTGQLGLAFVTWSPLAGIARQHSGSSGFPVFDDVAAAHGVSTQQVALAWALAKGQHVIPIPGASRPESILDSLAAVDLELSPEELSALG
jgi:aryl-alcohol dehydrogenase-like predicted oxidoreductase